ncbi:MAG: methyltransferase domain-containing protein [Gallionellaceae bacterium]
MQAAKQQWNAEDYAKNSSAQLIWAQELIAKLALRGDEAVLDIGCGDGKISAQLARAVSNGSVVAIDQSESMIRLATQQYPQAENPNLSFRQMDAGEIQFAQRFDIVFSNATLHWVQNHVAVLNCVHAVLKTGGKILLQMGGRGNAVHVFSAIEAVIQQARWRDYFVGFAHPYYFYGPEEYAAWLLESGFRSQRVELISKDMQHRGEEGLAGWLRTTWFPYTDRLPENLRDAFLAEVVQSYTSVFPLDAKGNSHVKMVRLEVEGLAL